MGKNIENIVECYWHIYVRVPGELTDFGKDLDAEHGCLKCDGLKKDCVRYYASPYV